MKKLLLLCAVFLLSGNFYAQETATKPKKAKAEKVDKAKAPAAIDAAAKKAEMDAKKAEAKAKRDAKKADKVAATAAATADAEKEAKKAAAKAKRDAKKAEKDASATATTAANSASADLDAKKAAAKAKRDAKKLEKETATKAATATTPKKVVKERESNEKAPKIADKVTGEYNGHKIMTGPRGGRYYINKNGNKTYISDDK